MLVYQAEIEPKALLLGIERRAASGEKNEARAGEPALGLVFFNSPLYPTNAAIELVKSDRVHNDNKNHDHD